LWLFIDTSKLN